jgi:hypothetical protein
MNQNPWALEEVETDHSTLRLEHVLNLEVRRFSDGHRESKVIWKEEYTSHLPCYVPEE